MQTKPYRYLFGPIHSRRLGRSLGIDLLDGRRCSFNCVFCEVGATDLLTLKRSEYVPTAAVIAEFKDWVSAGNTADVVTLAGSGEPTLHSRFGDIIDAVHTLSGLPVVLLTNSSMLWDPDVRESATHADIVKVSLSAWDDESLNKLNRPAADVTYERLLDGLHAFCECYKGTLWVETLLVNGVNDHPDQVALIAKEVARLAPDRVQLNTVVRPPPANEKAQAVENEKLDQLANLFTPKATVIAPHASDAEGQRRQSAHIEELARLRTRRSGDK